MIYNITDTISKSWKNEKSNYSSAVFHLGKESVFLRWNKKQTIKKYNYMCTSTFSQYIRLVWRKRIPLIDQSGKRVCSKMVMSGMEWIRPPLLVNRDKTGLLYNSIQNTKSKCHQICHDIHHIVLWKQKQLGKLS